MANQKDPNQLARELKWLDLKQRDPFKINILELRGRNVNEELQTLSMRPPLPGLIHVQNTVQTSENNNLPPTTTN